MPSFPMQLTQHILCQSAVTGQCRRESTRAEESPPLDSKLLRRAASAATFSVSNAISSESDAGRIDTRSQLQRAKQAAAEREISRFQGERKQRWDYSGWVYSVPNELHTRFALPLPDACCRKLDSILVISRLEWWSESRSGRGCIALVTRYGGQRGAHALTRENRRCVAKG